MAQDLWRRSGAQDPGRNDQTLDFAGPFVDFGDARIAVVALYRVFAAVAVAAVDLNRFVRDARGAFAGEQLGEGGVSAEAGAGGPVLRAGEADSDAWCGVVRRPCGSGHARVAIARHVGVGD